jgi:hypothetical protein
VKKNIISIFIIFILTGINIYCEESPFRHALTPYGAYHYQALKQSLPTGYEAGIQATEYFGKNLSIDLGIGFVFPAVKTPGSNMYRTLYLQAKYNLISLLGLEWYGMAGFMMEFDKIVANKNGIYIPTPKAGAGFGANYQLFNDLDFKSEVFIATQEIITKFGLEKRFTPIGGPAIDLSRLYTNIYISPTTNVYKFEDVFYGDINGHWAEESIIKVTKLDLIKEKNILEVQGGKAEIKFYVPDAPITRYEAAKMLVMATKLHEIFDRTVAEIEYVVTGNSGISYTVEIDISDKSGKSVKKLASKQKIVGGVYALEWDGQDNNKQALDDGKYFVNLEVMYKEKKVANNQTSTNVVTLGKPKITFDAPELIFVDVKEAGQKKYIAESADMGLFDLIVYENEKKTTKNISEKYYFEPLSNIRKLDFILSIGRALAYLGLETNLLPDLSPYKDLNLNQVSTEEKKYLGIYISVFGYGVDSYGKFYPGKNVTRAEAAVLIARFLDWKKTREQKKIPYFEKKIKTALIKKHLKLPEEKIAEKKKEPIKIAKPVKKEKKKIKKKITIKYRKKRVFKPLSNEVLKEMTASGAANKDKPLTFRVVVGSFLNSEKASAYKNKMEKISINPYVWERQSGRKNKRKYSLFTVHLASFDNLKEAKVYVKSVNAKNISAYIKNY